MAPSSGHSGPMALSRLRAEAVRRGADRLTESDVEAEIAAARADEACAEHVAAAPLDVALPDADDLPEQ